MANVMTDVETVVGHLKADQAGAMDRLMQWLRLPSIGTDPAYRDETRKAGQWAVDFLRGIGIEAKLRETGTPDKPGNPIVWAEHPGSKDYTGPHVLFYGHYDVQPPDPLDLWESPPFEPVVRDGRDGKRIVARGACDDKGQVATFLEALRSWKETTGEVPIRLTILIEGEEESGSVNLEKFVRDNAATLKKADVCLISDTGMLGPESPAITYGLRGLAYTEVVLHASNQDLHSGMWGGRCPNPITELIKALAGLWDADRRVTIPGFYDGVHPVDAAQREAWKKLSFNQIEALKKIGLGPEADVGEKGFTALEREWARPTCELNGITGGYQGKGAKTVIPSHASAKISFRLVDDQDPVKIEKSFFDWLSARTPAGCRWEFISHSGGAPATLPVDLPMLQAAKKSMSEAWNGAEAALIRTGGSIPVVGLFRTLLGVESVMMGFGLDDDRVHSPNEKFNVACFTRGAEAHARLIGALVNGA